MIWILDSIDDLFTGAFLSAGEPDQQIINRHMSHQPRHRQHQPVRPGVKRWYYLLAENPRISLSTVGRPLADWQGGAFFIVGTREIIGEFPGNQGCIGKKELQMKMQPLAWMSGQADQQFASGAQLLAEISEQILDLDAAERSQRQTKRRYEWH